MDNLLKVDVGITAADFSLPSTNGKEWRLSEKLGKIIALLFYPGNETLVCTKQLCSVRDNWRNYLETGAEVVGISPGKIENHLNFAGKHNLPLPLLSDANRSITTIYGKHSWMPIWATRTIVVIDAKGIIRYRNVMMRAMRPSDDEILAAINLAKYDVLTEKRATVATF